ncbi:MAG: hypothetical protein RIC95_09475 [Vicingaceae bacterium]
MKNIDINELQSQIQKSRDGEGFFIRIVRWVAWSVQVVIRWNFGIRHFPLTFLTTTAFWLILNEIFQPMRFGIMTVSLIDFSTAFIVHLWLSISFGALHLTLAHIREYRGKIQSTIYSGKPLIQYLFDKLPFSVKESTTKRFLEPLVVFLCSYFIPEELENYQAYLQFASLSMFIMAHRNYMYIRNMAFDVRDAEIQGRIMMNSENKDSGDETFIAEEGKIYSKSDFEEIKDAAIQVSEEEIFKAK